MQRPVKLLIAGLVIVGGVVVWMLARPASETVFLDLAADLSTAKDRRPSPDVFSVVSATLAGETRQAIHVKQPSRIKWEITVPDNAWFAFSLGLLPEAWTLAGDGVLFRVGISDMTPDGYEELFSSTINPYTNPGDQRWQHLTIDLSPYAGKRVELILNTNSSPPSPPGMPPRDDQAGDLALWGAPRIIIR
jgi:hypothetical protein